MLLRLVVLSLFIAAVASRYIDDMNYGDLRQFLDDQIMQIFVPRRMVRQADLLDYTPTPCRWKLCASFYR